MKVFNNQKEIYLLFFAFIFLTAIAISSKIYSNYLENAQNKVFNDLYNHPLKVSNTALKIQLNIYKMHLIIHDIALHPNNEELKIAINQLETIKEDTYNNFQIVNINILGDEGRKITKEALVFFKNWELLQHNIILLSENNNFKKAITILENDGNQYIFELTKKSQNYITMPIQKQYHFKKNSNDIFSNQQTVNLYLTIFILFIFIIVAYFSIYRLNNYISKNRNLTNSLKKKSDEFKTIIQEAPNPMMLHSEDGNIIILNKSWIDISGYTQEEIPSIDSWIKTVYKDKPTQNLMKQHIEGLYNITSKLNEGVFTFLTKKNKEVVWQFSSSPLGLIDGQRTVITSAMDITELKRKDEMLINQSRHAAMGEMIGMIAHQWRQPISIISMDANNILVDIELDSFNEKEAEEYANNINEQTQHLSKTIDDFRNFFKPDKIISEVNIKETIDSTLSIVKDSLKNNNIKLITSFETDKVVDAYPRELMQVFVNIITNSKDILTLNKPNNATITIRVYEDEKYINTAVSDNGGGIDSEILSKVFDPYFSTKEEKNGTGLGLYMCKMIIENHLHGVIEVYNNKDGACFTVRLLKNK